MRTDRKQQDRAYNNAWKRDLRIALPSCPASGFIVGYAWNSHRLLEYLYTVTSPCSYSFFIFGNHGQFLVKSSSGKFKIDMFGIDNSSEGSMCGRRSFTLKKYSTDSRSSWLPDRRANIAYVVKKKKTKRENIECVKTKESETIV